MVLQDKNAKHLDWKMGRILDVSVRKVDGHSRVATVKTSNGIFERVVHKLCPLPMQEEATR